MNRVADAIATWFGCGFFPIAPGTVGSAAALGLAWIVQLRWNYQPLWLLLPTALLVLPGIWAADVASKSRNLLDPGLVVVDEVLGQWITLAGATFLNWKSFLLGFLLFRIFDIWKPYPVRNLENLPGGTGIVADDLMAGVYGGIVLMTAGWFKVY